MAVGAETRVLLDSNVLLSALMFGGVPGRVLDAGLDQTYVLVTSIHILDEVQRALAGKFKHGKAAADERVFELAAMTWFVPEDAVAPDRLRDPDDDAVIAAARCASATVIVTGDHDILEAAIEGIEALTPAEFHARLEEIAAVDGVGDQVPKPGAPRSR